jgi:hypothetical protein
MFAELNAAGHRLVVLSWEGAFSLQEPALSYLRRLIGPDNEVELVYFCRRFAERIPSLWKQDVKRGMPSTLPEIVARVARNPMAVGDQNASLVWERWARVFGRDSLRIVSLNNLRDHKVDLFDHFALNFLQWDGTARPKRLATHESPDAVDTEMSRALNSIHLARTGQPNPRVFLAYMEKKPDLAFGPIPEAMALDTTTMKIDDKAGAFLPVYQAMMGFKDRLVSPEYGTELFTRDVSNVEYVRQNYLLQPGVVPTLQTIYRILRPTIEATPRRGLQAVAAKAA